MELNDQVKNISYCPSSSEEAMRINLTLLGRTLDQEKVMRLLVKDKGAVRYRDAYLLKSSVGEAWLFEYGVLVCWNINENDRQLLISELDELVSESADRYFNEQYSYCLDPDNILRIRNDWLALPSDDSMVRLALSHAFAQSTKLIFFEEKAQAVIQENSYISQKLAATGKVPLSRRELAQLRGVLFDTSSDITLHFNLLDTPEFFWDYPELEHYYLALAKYLDLTPRIDILNKKLSTIHELLDMLAAEQHHKHSSFLEWIIIVLIAVDILIYFQPK